MKIAFFVAHINNSCSNKTDLRYTWQMNAPRVNYMSFYKRTVPFLRTISMSKINLSLKIALKRKINERLGEPRNFEIHDMHPMIHNSAV